MEAAAEMALLLKAAANDYLARYKPLALVPRRFSAGTVTSRWMADCSSWPSLLSLSFSLWSGWRLKMILTCGSHMLVTTDERKRSVWWRERGATLSFYITG
jgi:hypothetical protein